VPCTLDSTVAYLNSAKPIMSTVSEQRAEVSFKRWIRRLKKKRLFTGRPSSLLAVVGLMVGAARAALVEVEAPAVLRVINYLFDRKDYARLDAKSVGRPSYGSERVLRSHLKRTATEFMRS
jgi:hypothetical protein